MKHRWSIVSVIAVPLVLSLACGSTPSSSGYRGKSTAVHHSPSDPNVARVPPDLALLPLTVRSTSDTHAGAAAQVRADVTALMSAATGSPHCTVELTDYVPPAPNANWSAVVQGTLRVDLNGAPDVLSRMDRIDACRAAIVPNLVLKPVTVSGSTTHSVVVGDLELELLNPRQHLPTLLTAESIALQRAVSGTAPQLHPGDLRCVPNGHVDIVDRSLAGIGIRPTMSCTVEAPRPTPPPDEAVGSL